MKTLRQVRSQLNAGSFDFTLHALERLVERNISESEIRQAGLQAVVIEEYPDDKYAPSCLLLGFTGAGRPLHLQVSLADTEDVRIVTIYEPDPEQWMAYSSRR